MKKTIIIKTDIQARKVIKIIRSLPLDGTWAVVFKETNIRNLEQNAKLWACLSEISQQVVWYGSRLAPEEWKIIFTAALKKTKIVPDIDGTGFVSLGASTSRMTIKEMSELIELMTAFAAEHNVKFSAPG